MLYSLLNAYHARKSASFPYLSWKNNKVKTNKHYTMKAYGGVDV
jgi:hypothetical protein